MNAPLRHPQEAASAVSLSWTAVVEPFMGRWEPVIQSNGEPRCYNSERLARAAASGRPGASTVYMGRSPLPPSVEAIRAVANPEPLPALPAAGIDLDALSSDRLSFDAWRI